MEVCALLEGLVTVEEFPAWMQPRTVVSLAHSSVANYIASEGFRETHKYDLSELPSHTFLAQSCVGYLLHFETNPFNKEPTGTIRWPPMQPVIGVITCFIATTTRYYLAR
jgi:hypothetical protein